MFSILIVSVLALYPVIFWILMRKFKKRLEEEKVRIKIGTLYEGIKLNKTLALYYNLFFILRRMLFAVACIFLMNYPFL